MINCPNCGAPITGHKCEYCGAIIFDFAADYIRKAREEMRTKTLGTPVEEEAEESGES